MRESIEHTPEEGWFDDAGMEVDPFDPDAFDPFVGLDALDVVSVAAARISMATAEQYDSIWRLRVDARRRAAGRAMRR